MLQFFKVLFIKIWIIVLELDITVLLNTVLNEFMINGELKGYIIMSTLSIYANNNVKNKFHLRVLSVY